MKFNAKELRQLTFPKGTLGYKKKDVDDFLLVASKDYFDYDKKIHKIEQEKMELNEEKIELKKELKFMEEKVEELKEQLTDKTLNNHSVVTSVKAVYGEDIQNYSLIQQVALTIEEEARAEAEKEIADAAAYYEAQKAQIEKEKADIMHIREIVITQLNSMYEAVFPEIEKCKENFFLSMEKIESTDMKDEGI